MSTHQRPKVFPGAPAWRKGPLITEDGNCVAHVYWRNGALVDSKGNSWTKVGSPPGTSAVGRIPPGSGALSGSAYYSLSLAGLNFAGDFMVAVVAMETTPTGSFGITLSTGNGSVGYVGLVVQSDLHLRAVFYPSGTVDLPPTVSLGTPFVLVFGRNGSGFYARGSSGSTHRSLAGSYSAGALAAVIGQLVGSTLPGSAYEIYATSTAYSDTTAGTIIAQVASKMGKASLLYSPFSSATSPGRVVCMGDSITFGGVVTTPYPTTLQTALGGSYTVVNAGLNGDQTSGMLNRWRTTYRSTSPTWMPILGGVNDAIGTGSIDSISLNLLTMYEEAQKQGCQIIPMTLTPWKSYASWTAPKGTVTDGVNSWIAWWCGQYGIQYVDLNGSALNDGSGNLAGAYDSGDHLHPNQAGTDLIETLVRAKFP